MSAILLVDGTGYVFRAYYAVKPMRSPAGVPVNAVFGLSKMVGRLVKQHRPVALAVVFDAGQRTFRNDIYPDYKANRPEPPEDLRPQFDLCAEAVRAMGIPVLRVPGYEADDVLGTLARQATAASRDVLIVTGDKDLMQLVGPGVRLLRYNPRAETEEVVDEEGVRKHMGVSPAQVVDVLGLMGDSSDNIPGVDGIGEKTAVELVNAHGHVEGVLAAAPAMKPGKRRDTLLAQADRARLSRQLATIKVDVPLDRGIDSLAFPGLAIPGARAFFLEHGFRSLLVDPTFAAPLQCPPEPPPAPVVVPVDRLAAPRVVLTVEELVQVVARCRDAGGWSLETLADGGDAMRARVVGLALSWGRGEACYVPVGHDLAAAPRQLPLDRVREVVGGIMGAPGCRLAAHNAKHHLELLAEHGFPTPDPAADSMLASYVLATRDQHDLDSVAERELSLRPVSADVTRGKGKGAVTWDRVPVEMAARHACERADAEGRLATVLGEALEREGLTALYRDVELPLSAVLLRMERTGVLVNTGVLRQLSMELRGVCQRLEREACDAAGVSFNVQSPKQLAEVLFDKLGLPVGRKTKTGPSTDMDVLEELSALHPLPAKILEHRQLSKLVSTYLDALPSFVNGRTGRLHTTYAQAVAATGRLSSQDPNLQNIPVRDDHGRRIRAAFHAGPGKVLLSADYNQIELRVLACLSRDPVLLESFRSGEDVHTRTASEIFHVAVGSVTRDQRRDAKTINFGLLYGMSAFGLSHALRIPRAQAKEYLEAYHARFQGVASWQQRVMAQARETGMVTTMSGRRRYLPGLQDKNPAARQAAERMAINSPVQGTAADIIKVAMVRLDRALRERDLPARMLLQVHDELVLEVEPDATEAVGNVVREVMASAAPLEVPLLVDVGHGPTWLDAH
jgi:DNA polymerase-1